MAKRAMILILLLTTAFLPVIAETWSVEPATAAYNNLTQGQAAVTINTRIRVSRTESSGTAKNLFLLVDSADPPPAAVGQRKLYLNNSSVEESISVRIWNTSNTEISTTTTSGTRTTITGSIAAAASSADLLFKINLPKDNYIINSGTYSCTFVFKLFVSASGYTNNLPAVAAGIFTVLVDVKTGGVKGSIAIFPTHLSFGSMHELPNTQTAKMFVTALKNFVIYIRSANLGKLMQQGSTSEIPYTLVITGPSSYSYTANLSISDQILKLGANAKDVEYTLTLTTATLDFPEAGDYSDTLTFSFTQP